MRLFAIPGAGQGDWPDMDKYVVTPAGETPHGTPVTLRPGDDWLFLADRTYDLPHEHAEGPCAVLLRPAAAGGPLRQRLVRRAGGCATTRPGTRQFSLTVWDFHGLSNDEGLKTLQGIAAKGELP